MWMCFVTISVGKLSQGAEILPSQSHPLNAILSLVVKPHQSKTKPIVQLWYLKLSNGVDTTINSDFVLILQHHHIQPFASQAIALWHLFNFILILPWHKQGMIGLGFDHKHASMLRLCQALYGPLSNLANSHADAYMLNVKCRELFPDLAYFTRYFINL